MGLMVLTNDGSSQIRLSGRLLFPALADGVVGMGLSCPMGISLVKRRISKDCLCDEMAPKPCQGPSTGSRSAHVS